MKVWEKENRLRIKGVVMIKRQNGYVLKKIKGTAYLLPYGQNIADQKRGLIFNETGELIWNFLNEGKTLEEITEEVAAYYKIPVSDREELGKDVEDFVSQLLGMGILKEELKKRNEPFYHCMEIGGICVKMCGQAEIFPKQFVSFFCEEKEADQTIEVKVAVPVSKPNGKVLIRNKEMSICEWDEGYLVLFHQMKNVIEGYMTKDGNYVRIHALMPQNEEEKDNLFHAIRLFYLYLAQKKGLYAIHSASILYRNRAWLFSGHSGMGKSTHTALWHKLFHTPYLNGDLNLIGLEDGELKVYGMPWCGTSGIYTRKTQELGGIVLLGRDNTDHLETLGDAEKIVRVMQRMISPAWTEEQMEKNLDFAKQIVEKSQVYYLKCTKESSAVQPIKTQIDQLEENDK